MLYHLADWFFLFLHSLLVIFNLFGWMRKAWLRANLATLLVTGGSWVFLGFFYGWGYCPLTDWQWQVLENLGKTPQTSSYIAYLFHRILGIYVTDFFADTLTLSTFLVALGISIVLNVRALARKYITKTP